MREMLRRILNVVFVRHCVICGRAVRTKADISVCHRCEDSIRGYGMTIRTVGRESVSVLPFCRHTRRAMNNFKFNNKKYYAYTFGELLYRRILEMHWAGNIECVTCVPMRDRDRAYNQSALIAKEIAERMRLPFVDDALVKVRYTPPAYKLGRKERLRIIRGAYDVGAKSSFEGKRVLLIDDIYTTGITLSECRRILMANGAAEVYCATACYGVWDKKDK